MADRQVGDDPARTGEEQCGADTDEDVAEVTPLPGRLRKASRIETIMLASTPSRRKMTKVAATVRSGLSYVVRGLRAVAPNGYQVYLTLGVRST